MKNPYDMKDEYLDYSTRMKRGKDSDPLWHLSGNIAWIDSMVKEKNLLCRKYFSKTRDKILENQKEYDKTRYGHLHMSYNCAYENLITVFEKKTLVEKIKEVYLNGQ